MKKIRKTAKALGEADKAVADAVAPYVETPPVRAISWLSEVGDQPPLRTLCAAVVAAGLAGPDPRLMRGGVRMIAAHTLATAAKSAIKHRVDRTRPHKDKDAALKPGRHRGKDYASFPSGHSAGAIAVARAYAREYPEHKAAALAGAGTVALAQIPRSAHYPTDVGSGLVIGWLTEALVDAVLTPLLDKLPPDEGL